MKPLNLISLRVWGDLACFTRPEMKVERVSYPIMTPSAARGILEAVFWEPQMMYLIESIRVVKRGRWISIRRNEVKDVISIDSVKAWMHAPETTKAIQAGAGGEVAQRNMLALQDVEYIITADLRITPLADRPEDKLEKYVAEIERRARAGKCFHRPGLGMREFAADFEWEADGDTAMRRRASELNEPAGQLNEDFGLMLYDVFDYRERSEGFRWLRADEISNAESSFRTSVKAPRTNKAAEATRWTRPPIVPQAAFFIARVEQSKLDCHPNRVRILTSQSGGD